MYTCSGYKCRCEYKVKGKCTFEKPDLCAFGEESEDIKHKNLDTLLTEVHKLIKIIDEEKTRWLNNKAERVLRIAIQADKVKELVK